MNRALQSVGCALALAFAPQTASAADVIVGSPGVVVVVGRPATRLAYGPVVQFTERNHVKIGATVTYRIGRVQFGLITTLHRGFRLVSPTLSFGYRLSR